MESPRYRMSNPFAVESGGTPRFFPVWSQEKT